MLQVSADEFVGVQGHDAFGVAFAVVFPVEADLTILQFDQSVVGDGYLLFEKSLTEFCVPLLPKPHAHRPIDSLALAGLRLPLRKILIHLAVKP